MKPVDLILCGSVAVRRDGARVGKGGGYSDLEFAIAREFGLVGARTPIITTIHPLQLVDEDIELKPHDIPVDFIITPDETVSTRSKLPRPKGIYWKYLDEEKIKAIPLLRDVQEDGILPSSLKRKAKVKAGPKKTPWKGRQMSTDLEKQILDTWNINNRINLYMLAAVPPEALTDVSASKGRSVAEQFAHIHNVRLMWLKAAAPELMDGQEKIEKETSADKKLLERCLKESGKAIEQLLKRESQRVRSRGSSRIPWLFLATSSLTTLSIGVRSRWP